MTYNMTAEEKEYLEKYDIAGFDRPSVTTDIALFSIRDEKQNVNYRKDRQQRLNILLIKRANYPYKDCWALPGGFAVKGENVIDTAYRELKEETGIADAYLEAFDIFGDKDRDPRGWIISNAFLSLIDVSKYEVRAGSDAWQAEWFDIEISKTTEEEKISGDLTENMNIPESGRLQSKTNNITLKCEYEIKLRHEDISIGAVVSEERIIQNYHEKKIYDIISNEGLAFDHAIIILKAFLRLRYRTENEISIVFDLMPDYFTLAQLQNAFEVILDKKLLVANFRRKIMDYVLETDSFVGGVGHRPAKLFKRNMEKITGVK